MAGYETGKTEQNLDRGNYRRVLRTIIKVVYLNLFEHKDWGQITGKSFSVRRLSLQILQDKGDLLDNMGQESLLTSESSTSGVLTVN